MRFLGGIGCLFFLAIFFFAPAAYAGEWQGYGPLKYRTQNPIYLEFLIPEPDRALALKKGELNVLAYMQYSNVFRYAGGSSLVERLDMEVARTTISVDCGIIDGMELGLDLPLIREYGGFLDPFIQKFHKIFGMPNGGRESVPNNQYIYRISERDAAGNEVSIYEVPKSHFGVSDIILHLKYNFIEETNIVPAAAWLFYFKLPTGGRGGGSGNGSIDYGFSAALEKSYKRLHGYLDVGYYVTAGHSDLERYINHQYFAGMAALEFNISRPVSVVVQVHGQTPITKGMGEPQWDSFPLDMIIGFQGYHSKLLVGQDFIWQIGFAEDLNSEGPSADFTALLTLGLRFGRERWAGDSVVW